MRQCGYGGSRTGGMVAHSIKQKPGPDGYSGESCK